MHKRLSVRRDDKSETGELEKRANTENSRLCECAALWTDRCV